MRTGVLLTNLGTPKSPQPKDVRTYLGRLLSDKRVVNLSGLIRYPLVYGLILPFRTKQSAHAYQAIWTGEGSPLQLHSESLVTQLQQKVGPSVQIALGMRHGSPSLQDALAELKECDELVILPLYPQYSSAATGSTLELVLNRLSKEDFIPKLRIISKFYQHKAYLQAQSQLIQSYWKEDHHLLFSYHGIPENQLPKDQCPTVCKEACPLLPEKQNCYRSQCFQTSRLLAEQLHLSPEQYSTAFQSRLGRTPWIKPYTDELLADLIASGIRKLSVACPSFVADCLETLEEIGIRAKEQWMELGGLEFQLIPCLNSEPVWVEAILKITCPEFSSPLDKDNVC